MFMIFTLRRPIFCPPRLWRASCHQKTLRQTQVPKASGHGKNRQGVVPYRSIACWYCGRVLDVKPDYDGGGRSEVDSLSAHLLIPRVGSSVLGFPNQFVLLRSS